DEPAAPRAQGELDGSPDEPIPGLELDNSHTPVPPAGARPSREDSGDVRRRLLSVGMRNLGVSGPIALEGNDASPELQPVTAGPTAPLTDEEKCFLEDVRARVKIAPRQDAYSRLGLPQTASQDQIRAAYLSLVKKFHPDRAESSAGLRQAQKDLQALFGLLRDAYEH